MINIRQSSGYGTVVHRNIYDNDDNGDDDSDLVMLKITKVR